MDITHLGHSSFRIRGKTTTIITDPFSEKSVGIKFPKNTEADIVTISHDHDDHNAASYVGGKPYVIAGPGEYEIGGVGVLGVSVYHDGEKGAKRGKNTVYRLEIDGMIVAHLGDLGHVLGEQELSQLGSIDILFVPVGGVYTITAEQAADVVHEIEPTIVIPMHYGSPVLNQAVFGQLAPVSQFLKEIGKEDTVSVPRFTVSRDKLPDQMQVVVIE